MPPIEPRRGLFARPLTAAVPDEGYKRPSTGRIILGSIGDALQQWSGGQATFAPLMRQREAQALEQAEYQRRQADQFGVWEAQQQWKRDNPEPVNNDTTNDYAFIAEKLGVEAANQFLRNMGDPTVTVPLGPNRIYAGPRSGLGGAIGAAAPTVPTAPVGKLKPLGGAAPQGAGRFR